VRTRFAQLPSHARTVAALVLAVLLLLGMLVVVELGTWFWQSHQRIGELEPRVARLLGYEQSTEQLRASEELVNRQLDGLVFPSASDAGSVGASVQQDVRRVLEGAGMSVLGSQVLGNDKLASLEVIRVKVTATGSMEALDQSLLDLGNSRPLSIVQSLEIAPLNVRRGEAAQEINVDFSLRVVRLL
jgi:general secretion pathway protein M